VRVLFHQGVPAPLQEHLHGHEVTTAFELGWSTLSNGERPRLQAFADRIVEELNSIEPGHYREVSL
jgi:hypothetical protein